MCQFAHQLYTANMQGTSLISQALTVHSNMHCMKQSRMAKLAFVPIRNANIVTQIFFILN